MELFSIQGRFGQELHNSREISSREIPLEERTMFKRLPIGALVVTSAASPLQYIGVCHAAMVPPLHPHSLQQKPKTVHDVPFQTKLCHAEPKYAPWNGLVRQKLCWDRDNK